MYSLLTPFLSNVFITADHRKGVSGGNSPGFGISLLAETTEGTVFVGEEMSNPAGEDYAPLTPEDIGKKAAEKLLNEVYRGGCVDSRAQALTSLYMVLGQKDVSKLISGSLSTYEVHMLRHIKDFTDVTFKIEPYINLAIKNNEEEDDISGFGSLEKVSLICVGIGFVNLSKPVL